MVIRGRLLILAGTVLAVGALASGCRYGFNAQSNEAVDDTTLTQAITAVHLASGSGNVSIQVGSSASVHRELHYDNNKPGPTTTVANGVLTLNDCGQDCTVDYLVTVPAAARIDGSTSSGDIMIADASSVDVQASSGNVSVAGATGQVSVTTSSGDIKAASAGGDVQARSTSGDITVSGVKGAATLASQSGRIAASGLSGAHTTAHASSGNVSVTADVVQNVDVQTTSGDVTITVPNGSYRVTTGSSSGDVRSGLGNDASAQYSISASTDSGDVRIAAK
jgi:hypothetical protein